MSPIAEYVGDNYRSIALGHQFKIHRSLASALPSYLRKNTHTEKLSPSSRARSPEFLPPRRHNFLASQ